MQGAATLCRRFAHGSDAAAARFSQVRVYELSQLALKFERHLLSEARPSRRLRCKSPHSLTGAPTYRWWTSKS